MSNRKVSYFYDSGIGKFNYGGDHPMKPKRIRLTNDLITGYGLHSKMKIYPINRSTFEELSQYHSKDYVKFLKDVTPDCKEIFTKVLDKFNVGEDSPIFDGLFEFSQISAGGSVQGARKLNNGETDIAINWAGGLHHAKRSEASGFCYINDIVLGILELLKYHPRVLYIDIDIHHGDGVEKAFEKTDRVMTCSFHKYGKGYFPGTGSINDVGFNKGENYAVNFPLNDGMDDESYFYIFKRTIDIIMNYYQPSAIVLQCGADTLAHDPLGCFNLTLKGPGECVKYVKGLGKPLLVLGGGGYNPKNVAKCWVYETSLLIGETELSNILPDSNYFQDYPEETKLHIETLTMKNLNEKKHLDKTFFQILEHLKQIEPAPSVGTRTVPYETLKFEITSSEEEDELDKREEKGGYLLEEEEDDEDDEFSWDEEDNDFNLSSTIDYFEESYDQLPSFLLINNKIKKREKQKPILWIDNPNIAMKNRIQISLFNNINKVNNDQNTGSQSSEQTSNNKNIKKKKFRSTKKKKIKIKSKKKFKHNSNKDNIIIIQREPEENIENKKKIEERGKVIEKKKEKEKEKEKEKGNGGERGKGMEIEKVNENKIEQKQENIKEMEIERGVNIEKEKQNRNQEEIVNGKENVIGKEQGGIHENITRNEVNIDHKDKQYNMNVNENGNIDRMQILKENEKKMETGKEEMVNLNKNDNEKKNHEEQTISNNEKKY
ncbi:histone deacetylase rpd3 [Anaeramoeba flamelloides]|uniref:histone deacetylase n=1 Tax=Anaeramoeba flamelloides TaxID=1746091 RepID=A0ABQ8YJK9_9EUKA|nr:histone deacetylase rpd3 [Anaeramoeba flamelloides]